MMLRHVSLALILTAAMGCASTNQQGQDTNKAAAATDGNSDNNNLRPNSAPPAGRDTERAKERDEEKADDPKAIPNRRGLKAKAPESSLIPGPSTN